MNNKEIMDYNSNRAWSKKDINKIKNTKLIHITQFNKYRRNILTINNEPLKKNIFLSKNSIKKENKKNHLNIKIPKLENIYNVNNNIKNIYLSNSSSNQNIFIPSITERNNYYTKQKSRNNPYNISNNVNLLIKNNYDSSRNNNISFRNKNKLFMRKIDLEINEILKHKKQNINNNLKTLNKDIKNINNIKLNNFNTINYIKKSNNYDKRNQDNNNLKIRKNKSEKIITNFSRKVLYLNQKNNFISEENIINLIQKEEKALNNNFSDYFMKDNKLKQINDEDKKYKTMMPFISEYSLNKSKKIKLKKNNVNYKYFPEQLSKDKNDFLSNLSINNAKDKEEKKVKENNNNYINKIPKKEKPYFIDEFSDTEEIKNNDELELKTTYNQCYETYEFGDNVDNYKENKYDKIKNYFSINSINNYNYKKNNYILNKNNSKNIINSNINIYKDINNIIQSQINNLSENSIKSNDKKIQLNNILNNYLNLKQFKAFENEKIIKSPKKNRKKPANSDIIEYLSNYNISAQKFFDIVLKEEKPNKEHEKKIYDKIKEIFIINEKNKNNINNISNINTKNKLNVINNKRTHKYWSVKSFNKQKIKDEKNLYKFNNIKKEKKKINSDKSKSSIKNLKSLSEEKEINVKKNIVTEQSKDQKYNTINHFDKNEQLSKSIKLQFNNMLNNNIKNKKNKNNDIKNIIQLNDTNEEIQHLQKTPSVKKSKSKNISFINNISKEKEIEKKNSTSIKKNNISNNSKLLNKSKTKNQIQNDNDKDKHNDINDINNENNIINDKSLESKENNIDNKELFEDDEEEIDENNNDINITYKRRYSFQNKISFNELSFLDDKKIDTKEKLKLIKVYKEKATENIYTIVKDNLNEKKELQLNKETLIKFLIIKSYKKLINIMKLLTAKSRILSGFNVLPTDINNIKDEEIINYIYRLFCDETSSYYLLDKSKNKNSNTRASSSSILNNINLGKLSHKKYKFMNELRENDTNHISRKKRKKTNIKKNNFLSKLKPIEESNIKKTKNFQQLIGEGMRSDKHKQSYLSYKMNLTNELKYQIGITHNEEGKQRFKMLLEQIESMKEENIKDYFDFLNDTYNFYKVEIKDLIKDREKEERINNFLHNLIDDRDNILKRKTAIEQKLHLEDNKFESLMGEEYL